MFILSTNITPTQQTSTPTTKLTRCSPTCIASFHHSLKLYQIALVPTLPAELSFFSVSTVEGFSSRPQEDTIPSGCVTATDISSAYSSSTERQLSGDPSRRKSLQMKNQQTTQNLPIATRKPRFVRLQDLQMPCN